MSNFSKAISILFVGAVGLIAILLGGNLLLALKAQARLSAKFSAIRAAGQPASLAELAPEPINAEQNAAVQMERIARPLESWEKRFLHEFEETDLGKAWDDGRSARGLPTAEQVAAMEPIFAAYPKIVPAFEKAAAAPAYASLWSYNVSGNQFVANMMTSVQRRRTLANFIATKMRILAAQGKRDEAVALGVKMLRLTRHFDNDPVLVTFLVNCALRGITVEALNSILQSGPVGTAARLELEQELTLQNAGKPFVHALQTERAAGEAFVAQATPPLLGFLGWPIKNWQADVLDYYDEAIPAAGKPYFQSGADMHKINSQHSAGSTFVKLLGPSIESGFIAENRTVVYLHCLRVLSAINGFVQEHGRDPSGLDELGLAAPMTLDPFSGQPLRLKRIENGWVIYSVFQNGLDDGGDFKDMKDFGLAPAGYQQEAEPEQKDDQAN
jgi:hypothetical protein